MARRFRWCLPLALTIAACQTQPLSSPRPEPAPRAADPVMQVLPAWHPGGSNASVEWQSGGGYDGYGNWGYQAPTTGGAPSGDARAYYPDLTAIAPSTFYIDSSGGHRYLRFQTAIGNSGPGLLRIRGQLEGNVTRGTQEIVDARGNVVATRDVGTFEYHPNHGHFHVSYVARYELHRGDVNGEKVQDGKKISFCMEDSIRFRNDMTQQSQIPDCSPTMQGITPGFADVYSAGLPEQIFDVTNMPSGDYTITIQLDPLKKFLETNRDNNFAWVQIHYDAAAARALRVKDYP